MSPTSNNKPGGATPAPPGQFNTLMKRTIYASTALLAAGLLIAALSKCSVPHAATATPVARLRTAGNVTATRQEVQVVWERASVLLVLSTTEQVGSIKLCRDGAEFCTPARCYVEYPAGWFADWGYNGDHLRIFANGHAEGRVNGKEVYFTPLGSGQCFPENR